VFRIDERNFERWLRRGWFREAGWIPSAPPDRKSCVQLIEVVEPYLELRMAERLATDPDLAASLFVRTLPASQRWNLVKHAVLGAQVRSSRNQAKARQSPATRGKGAIRLRFALKRRFPATESLGLEQLSEVAQASDDARVAEALWTDDLVDSVREVAHTLAGAAAAQGMAEANTSSQNLETRNEEAKIMVMEEELLFTDEESPPAHSDEDEFEISRPPGATFSEPAPVPVPEPSSHALTTAEFRALSEPASAPQPPDFAAPELEPAPADQVTESIALPIPEPEVPVARQESTSHDLGRWEQLERQLEKISSALERASENLERQHSIPPPAVATTTQDIASIRESLAPLVEKLGEHAAIQQKGSHEITNAIGRLKSDLESLPLQIAAAVPIGGQRPPHLGQLHGMAEQGRSRLPDPGLQLACVSLLATAWAVVFCLRLSSPPLAAASLVLAIAAAGFAITKWGRSPTSAE